MKRITIPLLLIIIFITVTFLTFPKLETRFTDLIGTSSGSLIQYAMISFAILSVDFILPVPSSVLMFSNGFILGLVAGFSVSIAASLTSNFLGYYLGRMFERRSSKLFKASDISAAHSLLRSYGFFGIIISRGIPIISESVSIVCGNLSYDWRKFLAGNVIGFIPVCAMYTYLGSLSIHSEALAIAFGMNLVIAGALWFSKGYLERLESASKDVT